MVPTVLGLARPRARFVLGAALVGGSAWFLTSLLALALAPHLPHATEEMGKLATIATAPSLVATLVAVALVPAVCEEVLFRGLFARGLAARLGAPLAIVISAAAFAAYHCDLVRLAPTFLLGLGLAIIAIRANSILPTMLAHLLNNTCAILVSRSDAIATPLYQHPVCAGAGAAILTAAGLALVLIDRHVDPVPMTTPGAPT